MFNKLENGTFSAFSEETRASKIYSCTRSPAQLKKKLIRNDGTTPSFLFDRESEREEDTKYQMSLR